jgi:hypothetical protein
MSSSTSRANNAYVRVEVTARGVDCTESAQRASLAVAEWLDTVDTSTIGADLAAYVASRTATDEDGEPLAWDESAAARYEALCDAAYDIAFAAATTGWARPDGAYVTLDIEES